MSKPLKIGIFNPYFDTLSGGEKYMLTIAECLALTHRVSILWDDPALLAKAADKFGLSLANVVAEDNIFSSRYSFLKRLKMSKKYDVIIYLSDGAIPVVLSSQLIIHFQFPVEWLRYSMKTKLKMKRVTDVICNSEFTKQYIDKKFHLHSSLLYPPVNIKKQDNLKKEKMILHVGRFSISGVEGLNYKKQDVLINAFKEMVDEGLKGWEFVLVTSVKDEDEEAFQKLKEATKGYPIKFVVNPKNTELWRLYSKAKIYWHASGYGENIKEHPELAEHFGISTVEAMGAGAVPIVINAGGQKESVSKENGFLWDTIPELKKYTTKVIEDEKLRKKLSTQAEKNAEKFSKEKFCHEINSIVARKF